MTRAHQFEIGYAEFVDAKEPCDVLTEKHVNAQPRPAYLRAVDPHPAERSKDLLPGRKWTEHEQDRLRMLWGVHSVAHVARELRRSEGAVYLRAQRLGLGVGCPQGWEYVAGAAERAGFTHPTMWRILRWANVHVRRAMAHPTAPNHRHIVEPADVDDAVADWCKRETIAEAARRVGYNTDTLRIALNHAAERGDIDMGPHRRRQEWRLLPETVDAVVAKRALRETWATASRRTGHSINTLRSWMWRAGFRCQPKSRRWNLKPTDIDRVVAERRLTSTRAGRTKTVGGETK